MYLISLLSASINFQGLICAVLWAVSIPTSGINTVSLKINQSVNYSEAHLNLSEYMAQI